MVLQRLKLKNKIDNSFSNRNLADLQRAILIEPIDKMLFSSQGVLKDGVTEAVTYNIMNGLCRSS
jgi:hypothetical protein